MEITAQHSSDPTLLRNGYEKFLSDKPSLALHSDLLGFFDALVAKFPLVDWLGRPQVDFFSAVVDFYSFIEHRDHDTQLVNVYNPTLDEHGWICGRTVVAICCLDRPFLVDSIRIVLEQGDYALKVGKSTILSITRDSGCIKTVNAVDTEQNDAAKLETLVVFEISNIVSDEERQALTKDIATSLTHVEHVVTAYPEMLEQLTESTIELLSINDSDESHEFLQWLRSSNFTFLGYRELNFDAPVINGESVSDRSLKEDCDARLGIFNGVSCDSLSLLGSQFSEGARSFYQSSEHICFSKSNTRSTVHRHVYPDYIVVKKYNAEHQLVGERRFLGFFTYAVSAMSPTLIPILRQKIKFVIEKIGFNPSSHDGKRLARIIDLHPKEELFQSTSEELYECFTKVIALNERDIVRLITRKDPFDQFFTCLVYVPKDLYTTDLRLKIQALIGEELGTVEQDSTTFFSESKHARAHIVFRLPEKEKNMGTTRFDVGHLEPRVIELAYGWSEHFKKALDERFGENKGGIFYKRYLSGIPKAYQEAFDSRAAISDISIFESLTESEKLSLHLYRPLGSNENEMKFKIAHYNSMLELSDVIPILENMGLRVLGEQPFRIKRQDGIAFWIHDFQLKLGTVVKESEATLRKKFEDAFKKVWSGEVESDLFNQLVLVAGLSWREINLLRTYANYMKQTLFHLTQDYIAETLVSFPAITKNLLRLFAAKFDPSNNHNLDQREQAYSEIVNTIETDLENIRILNQDKVFRRFIEIFSATLRVNFYQAKTEALAAPYLSIKLAPTYISDIPNPKPKFEFFVYSARVEGSHLRTSKVARGGLRWSDRAEDYRTEVLGLVKAQQVKNAVIVPSGAKGGFVAKKLPVNSSRAQFLAEGIECYKMFIRGLLDLTDNLVEGEIVKPENVVCLDDDDAYLVVAADKGTATFSDIANEISLEKGHWLGDAFASGGSQGYDHKGMGITAKGAWVSVQRLFREKAINTQVDPISVVGIGDMAGDVFGNGMLLSRSVRMVAAFNHMHIFIDPEPDAELTFKERERLFFEPGTNWADFNPEFISKGGGVFDRSEKFIKLSPEIKALISSDLTRLTPNDLIHALLQAEVDLIWNGGIGTYVKSSKESHASVGDKANDCLRVNGSQLRCKVFGEGGNLGMTQLGRVEFALNGGACNTDFIDNAAGVDCSDHEVNIKILIDALVASGDLTAKQRNELLVSMTDAVAELVLKNNYNQTLALSIAEHQVPKRMNEYRRFMSYLEQEKRLDRALEFLPSDSELVERIGRSQPLTRPELSVLISYAKVQLKEALVNTNIASDPYCAKNVFNVFPQSIHARFEVEIKQHKLKNEIISTQLANDFINSLGITSLHRLLETTGSSIEEVVKAYVVSRDVFGLPDFINYVASMDYELEASYQHELISKMVRRVRRGTRWFLKNRRSGMNVQKEVDAFRPGLMEIRNIAGDLLPNAQKEKWQATVDSLSAKGLDSEWSTLVSMPDNLFSGISVVDVSLNASSSAEDSALMFFHLLDALKLDWFATILSELIVENSWQASAREAYIDDLEAQLRKLAVLLLKNRGSSSVQECIAAWLEANKLMVARWTKMVTRVEAAAGRDYAMFAVALRELNDLVQVTYHG